AFQRRPRAVGRDEPEDREERAEDAARGRQRVHATGCVAARLDVAQQEPDREGAHAAEQHDRRREQQHDRQQRPRDEADAQLLETLLRYEQDRVADERDDADPQARPSGDLVQHLFARMPAGAPPFGSGSPRPRRRILVAFCVSAGIVNLTWPPLIVGAETSPPRSATWSGTGTTTRRSFPSLPSRVKTGSAATWTVARRPGTRSTVPSLTPGGTRTSTRRPPGSSTVRLVPR